MHLQGQEMQMQMQEPPLKAQALCKIVHRRRTRRDSQSGLWLYDTLDEQEVHNLITDAGRVTLHTFIYGLAAD